MMDSFEYFLASKRYQYPRFFKYFDTFTPMEWIVIMFCIIMLIL
jgi:hypothetical protein